MLWDNDSFLKFVLNICFFQAGNSGFSIGAAKKTQISSLLIGPGAGYNLVSGLSPLRFLTRVWFNFLNSLDHHNTLFFVNVWACLQGTVLNRKNKLSNILFVFGKWWNSIQFSCCWKICSRFQLLIQGASFILRVVKIFWSVLGALKLSFFFPTYMHQNVWFLFKTTDLPLEAAFCWFSSFF